MNQNVQKTLMKIKCLKNVQIPIISTRKVQCNQWRS